MKKMTDREIIEEINDYVENCTSQELCVIYRLIFNEHCEINSSGGFEVEDENEDS
jgi:hypothetical protein